MNGLEPTSLDAAVHLVQSALTPVFLLSGIATLLNVFAGRLARVADRLDVLTQLSLSAEAPEAAALSYEITLLHRRLIALDTAVVLGAVGAAATCVAILTLFLLGLGQAASAGILRLFFGGAIVCTLGSVAMFGAEMLLSSNELRGRMQTARAETARGASGGEQ